MAKLLNGMDLTFVAIATACIPYDFKLMRNLRQTIGKPLVNHFMSYVSSFEFIQNRSVCMSGQIFKQNQRCLGTWVGKCPSQNCSVRKLRCCRSTIIFGVGSQALRRCVQQGDFKPIWRVCMYLCMYIQVALSFKVSRTSAVALLIANATGSKQCSMFYTLSVSCTSDGGNDYGKWWW